MTSTVGVVVPVRDRAAVIARALTSVLAQTAPADEIVVVDDGSEDHSADIAEDLGVEVLRTRRRGPSAARNLGVRHLRSDHVAFLDADDAWKPTYLANVHERLDVTSGPCLVAAGHVEVTLQGELIGYVPPPAWDLPPWRVFLGTPLLTSGVVAHRRQVLDVGGFDETLPFSQDTDLWFRLLRSGAVDLVANPCPVHYTIRTTPESLAKLKRVEAAREHLLAKLRDAAGLPAHLLDHVRREMLIEMGRRYEYSGHIDDAVRCLRAAGVSPRTLAWEVLARSPARYRASMRRAVRAVRRGLLPDRLTEHRA